MIKHTLGSAWLGLIGGALSVVVACAGEDPADKKGSGGTGGTGGTTGGVGGATGGTGGTGGAVGGTAGTAVGGTAGTAVGGTAGTAVGGAGAGGGAGVPGGSSGTAGGSAAGSGSGTAGSAGDAAGGMAGGGGMGGIAGMGGAPVVGAMAAYHFDTASVPLAGAGGAGVDGTEGWAINSGACKANGGETSVTVTQLTEQHQAGTGSLKIAFTGIPTGAGGMGAAGAAGTAGSGAGAAGGGAGGAAAGAAGAAGSGGAAPVSVDCHIKKTAAPLETGKTITYQIWISPDAGGSVGWIKLILEAGATYSWVSPPQTDAMPDIPLTTRSAWVMKSFTVPVSVVPPIQSIGFQIGVQNTFTGSIYIDEVMW